MVESTNEGAGEVHREESQGKWRKDLPEPIKGVLQEYDDVFPNELPQGLPPIHRGFEFKIDLEDNTPPMHRPIYIS